MKNKLDADGPFEYNDTDKEKGQLLGHKDIKLSFISKEYEIDAEKGEITCILGCKLSLKPLEKHVTFSDKLKRTLFDGLMFACDTYCTESKVSYLKRYNGKRAIVITEEPKHSYNYIDGFQVKATVKVQSPDKFDETTGKILSEAKAKKKAYMKASNLMYRFAETFNQLMDSFDGYGDKFLEYWRDENNRFNSFGGFNDKFSDYFDLEPGDDN